ncbi:MAG: redoxin domain-containing protein, partial [Saprospiraceae bacterium]
MSLQIGDKAPDFSIYSSDKELIHLHDYIGKNVVLLFFPLAFTSTCT